jgi:hypothetical protein
MAEEQTTDCDHKYHLKPDGNYYCEFCGEKLVRKPADESEEVDLEDLISQESSVDRLMCEQASEERENLHELRRKPGARAAQRRWADERWKGERGAGGPGRL